MSGYKPSKHKHQVLDRLHSATGLSDKQLEHHLGTADKYLYDCRISGTIPYGHIVTAVKAGVIRVDLHWLLTGTRFVASGN